MVTLAELILRRKQQLGLSFRQLGQQARAAGMADTEPNWNHLANRPLQEFPKVRTIHALAAALDVTPEEVAQAALESLGLHAKQTGPIVQPGEQWILVSTDDLSADDEADIRKKITDATARTRGQRDPG